MRKAGKSSEAILWGVDFGIKIKGKKKVVDEDTEVINYLLILFFRFPLFQVLK